MAPRVLHVGGDPRRGTAFDEATLRKEQRHETGASDPDPYRSRARAEGLVEPSMLSQTDLQIALAFALRELGPAWKIVSDCPPVDPLDPDHWASGVHSVQVTLRHRVSGQLKVLGRRVVADPNASVHRGLALQLIEAYGQGNADPLRRYLEEVGVAAVTAREAHVLRRPAVVTSPGPPGSEAELMEAGVSVAVPKPPVGAGVDGDADIASHASHSAVSKPGRPIGGTPKWPSLSTVTSRWRREASRPALTHVPAASGESRSRMLSRLRRELVIWQWRRAAISGRDKSDKSDHTRSD